MKNKSTFKAALDAYIDAYGKSCTADPNDITTYDVAADALVVARDVVKVVAIANGINQTDTYAALAEARANYYASLNKH